MRSRILVLGFWHSHDTMNLASHIIIFMPVTELLPNLQKLSRADKLKVMQFIILELSREEETESSLYEFQSHGNDSIDSPCDSYEAAYKMNKMLEEYKQSKNV